jgi:hypothetical protein
MDHSFWTDWLEGRFICRWEPSEFTMIIDIWLRALELSTGQLVVRLPMSACATLSLTECKDLMVAFLPVWCRERRD